MKKYILCVFALCGCVWARAQNITRIEYYLDTDPGYGLATNVPLSVGTPINDFDISVPMTNVTDGFHKVYVRAKDANGAWSMVSSHQFLRTTITLAPVTPIPTIVKAEYFIDTDPGYGLATNVPLTAGTPINNLLTTINIIGLNSGSHIVYVRTKDVNGMWSIIGNQSFIIGNNAILIGETPPTFCRSTNFNIPVTVYGAFNSGNIFTVELLNSSNNVVQTLGTLTTSGTITANILNSIALGDYNIRVTSSNPTLNAYPTVPITITALCQCLTNISLMTGNWGTPTIWSCGHVPLATEPVQISAGHTVTLDVNGVAKSVNLLGILNPQTSKVLTIQGN
jgi:hypothetical protein